ncbi:hypothetical protein AWV79_04315 [Cupriavidus sp. UYMMa02A]|nr:hypothetical protein AWV79_04315 [Cupriavidus sp. UYMMa02A]
MLAVAGSDWKSPPRRARKEPALFWGLVGSMWIGNLMLIGIWVKLLKVPYRYLPGHPGVLLQRHRSRPSVRRHSKRNNTDCAGWLSAPSPF